jgi:hypothetical protein
MGCTRMGLYILYAREVQRAKTARQENELTPGLTVREQIELGAKWKPHEWLSDAINNFVDWNEMIWLLKMATFLDFRHVVSLCTFCTLAHGSTTRSTLPTLQRLFGRLRGLAGDQLDAEASLAVQLIVLAPWKPSKSTGTWPSNELLVAMALAQNQTQLWSIL